MSIHDQCRYNNFDKSSFYKERNSCYYLLLYSNILENIVDFIHPIEVEARIHLLFLFLFVFIYFPSYNRKFTALTIESNNNEIICIMISINDDNNKTFLGLDSDFKKAGSLMIKPLKGFTISWYFICRWMAVLRYLVSFLKH